MNEQRPLSIWNLWARRWTVFFFVMTFLGSGAATWTVMDSDMMSPTVKFLTLQEFQGDGIADQRLNIYYKFVRRRECQTTQLRWLWQWRERDGHPVEFVVPLDMSMIPLASAGHGESAEIIVSYAMPAGIEAGDWYFVSKTMDFCGLLSGIVGPTFTQTPDIPIHIQPPGSDDHRKGEMMVVPSGGGIP